MDTTELEKRKQEEYEVQLYGHHSRAVYATFKSIIMERIQSKIKKMCDTLRNTYNKDCESLNTIEEQLIRAYCKASLPHLKDIKRIVNKFTAIPSNVLLDEDKLQATQYTDAEFQCMKSKLDNLQQRAKHATILNVALKEELQLIEQCSIHANDIDKLSHLMNTYATCSNNSEKIYQLMEVYKQLNLSLDERASPSQKTLYNTIDNLHCIDYDLDYDSS